MKVVEQPKGPYLRPCELQRKYHVGRTTMYNLLKEMRADPKFSGAVLDISRTLHRVDEKAFEEFMQSRNKKYLTQ